ncbi:MAG: AEC family transporter [Bacillota bacterium]
METLAFTLRAIGPLLLLGAIGYFLRKSRILDDAFIDRLNTFVFSVALPALIFTTIASIDSFENLKWDVVLFTVGVIILIALLAYFVIPLFNLKWPHGAVLHQGIHRGNFVFIGIPLAMRLGGQSALEVLVVFNAFLIPLTNAIALFMFDHWSEDTDKEAMTVKSILNSTIINPIMISTLLGLLMHFVLISFDSTFSDLGVIAETLEMIASTATPLALIAIGGQFYFKRMTNFKKPLVFAVVGRMVTVPVLAFSLVYALHTIIDFSGTWSSLIAIFASPVAIASVAVSKGMNHDSEVASHIVVLTTLVSAVTLLTIITLFRFYGLL